MPGLHVSKFIHNPKAAVTTFIALLTATIVFVGSSAASATATRNETACTVGNPPGCALHQVYRQSGNYFHMGDAEVVATQYWYNWMYEDCKAWLMSVGRLTSNNPDAYLGIYGSVWSYRISDLQLHVEPIIAGIGNGSGCRYAVNVQGGDINNGPTTSITVAARWVQ
jgi:hypothetical protein